MSPVLCSAIASHASSDNLEGAFCVGIRDCLMAKFWLSMTEEEVTEMMTAEEEEEETEAMTAEKTPTRDKRP
ncbi:hypothetical protein Droror1_Dr00006776 [Drosera rotundifolia]